MSQSCAKYFTFEGHGLLGGKYQIEVKDPQTGQVILTIVKNTIFEAMNSLAEAGYRVVGGCGGCRGCHGCG